LVKFTVLALASVVVLYLLIDLFEEFNYFTSRKVGLLIILLYYLYELPSAVNLLYPVSLLLAVFVVYGQMVRHREFHALKSAGVSVYRLFAPAVVLGLGSVGLYLAGSEYVTVPANRRLSDLRRFRIERRTAPSLDRRQNVYLAAGGQVLYARETEADSILRDFSVINVDPARQVRSRTDGREAVFIGGHWRATDVSSRTFDSAGREVLVKSETIDLAALTLRPSDFAGPSRPIEETRAGDLRDHIIRMKRAGENVAAEEVEYHYRFSYSLIGLVVVLLGLPMAVQLRKGGVMFGLGLGLLFSFLYWGAIQTGRAYGTSHVISPAMAAWLPNIVFGCVAAGLLCHVER
jgi:lipopolysaccharide export system permease protein